MLERLWMELRGVSFLLFLGSCAFLAPQTPIDVAPLVAVPAPVIANLPSSYHAEEAVVFVMLTADIQNTTVLADREALAAAYPGKRVCVLGVDSGSVERDNAGNEWYGVLGLFCMPPAAKQPKAVR